MTIVTTSKFKSRPSAVAAARNWPAATASPCGTRRGDPPMIEPIVTEYQRHRLVCRGCGETTCAALQKNAQKARLEAGTALLMGCFV